MAKKYVYKTPVKFRVAVVKNGKVHRNNVYDFRFLKSAMFKYHNHYPASEVLIPKIFINSNGLKPKITEVLLLKKLPTDDIHVKHIISDNGSIIEEKTTGGWQILQKRQFLVEETYKVYGLKKRLVVLELLKQVFLPRINEEYQVLMFKNKILIDNLIDLEVILCKNVEDCKRLYNFLFDCLKRKDVNNLAFLGGIVTLQAQKRYVDRMQSFMGLKPENIIRSSTNG